MISVLLALFLLFPGLLFSAQSTESHTQIGSGNKSLHIISVGNPANPPVLFIHGSPGDWKVWQRMMNDPKLAGFHLIAVDRPGYGQSQPGIPMLSISEQSNLIAEALKQNRSNQSAIIVGHSYGGAVASQLATTKGIKVKGLVLAAPALDPKLENHFYYNVMNVAPQALPEKIRVSTKESVALPNQLENLGPELTKINSVPVVFIQGSRDIVVSTKTVRYARKVFANTTFDEVSLKGQGHSLPRENPESIIQGVLQLSRSNPLLLNNSEDLPRVGR
ncbi:MAG: alpha/beta hydrolase [Bdellovibrionota bacterium]